MTDLTRLQSIFKEFRESTVLVEKAIAPKCAMPVKPRILFDASKVKTQKLKPFLKNIENGLIYPNDTHL